MSEIHPYRSQLFPDEIVLSGNKGNDSKWCGSNPYIQCLLQVRPSRPRASSWVLSGGFFTSLLLRLDEHALHALTINTSSIERILADIVAITLKAVNSIKINNLWPVDTHEVRMLRQHFLNTPQSMINHLVPLIRQEYDASILKGSHPHNLVIPHLLPLLVSLNEEAIPHFNSLKSDNLFPLRS